MRLEKHEKDFLAAYRYHMVKVQQELTDLKNMGTQLDLQKKQDKKIAELDMQIAHFKADCLSLMRYCKLQQQKITDLS